MVKDRQIVLEHGRYQNYDNLSSHCYFFLFFVYFFGDTLVGV